MNSKIPIKIDELFDDINYDYDNDNGYESDDTVDIEDISQEIFV